MPSLPAWPHDYVLLRGEFRDAASGEEVALPRVKLTFRHSASGAEAMAAQIEALQGQLAGRAAADADADATAAGAAAAPAAAPVEPLDAELEARVMALELELDGDALEVLGCYQLQDERCEQYAALLDEDGKPRFPKLGVSGGLAVTVRNGDGAARPAHTLFAPRCTRRALLNATAQSRVTLCRCGQSTLRAAR